MMEYDEKFMTEVIANKSPEQRERINHGMGIIMRKNEEIVDYIMPILRTEQNFISIPVMMSVFSSVMNKLNIPLEEFDKVIEAMKTQHHNISEQRKK